MFARYRVEIEHDSEDGVDIEVFDVGDSDSDRESVAWALEEAAKRIRTGLPITPEKLH